MNVKEWMKWYKGFDDNIEWTVKQHKADKKTSYWNC